MNEKAHVKKLIDTRIAELIQLVRFSTGFMVNDAIHFLNNNNGMRIA